MSSACPACRRKEDRPAYAYSVPGPFPNQDELRKTSVRTCGDQNLLMRRKSRCYAGTGAIMLVSIQDGISKENLLPLIIPGINRKNLRTASQVMARFFPWMWRQKQPPRTSDDDGLWCAVILKLMSNNLKKDIADNSVPCLWISPMSSTHIILDNEFIHNRNRKNKKKLNEAYKLSRYAMSPYYPP